MRMNQKFLQLSVVALTMLSISQTAEARRFRVRAVPIVHAHSNSATQESEQSHGTFAPGPIDETERERKIQMIGDGILVERREGESDASYEKRKEDMIALFNGAPKAEVASVSTASEPVSGSPKRGFGWLGLLPFLFLLLFARRIFSGIIGLVSLAKSSSNLGDSSDGFDDRMSRRMAELNRGN